MEGFPSGQRDQTVNLTAQPSVVRIHLPPPYFDLSLLKFKSKTEMNDRSGCRILAITSAFQADEAGSIPATRSNLYI